MEYKRLDCKSYPNIKHIRIFEGRRRFMLVGIVGIFLCVCLTPLFAQETEGQDSPSPTKSKPLKIGVEMALFNSIASSEEGIEDWTYSMAGEANLFFKTKSRNIRGELAIAYYDSLYFSLKKIYISPYFGDVRVSLGKTRSTWGKGFAFNAGDVIFGSDTVSINTLAEDPRDQTAWLTNVTIPLGDFSFLELIALPGQIDFSTGELPGIEKSSIGGRMNFEVGDFSLQGGYLYRGDDIAGLGTGAIGHRPYISVSSITPIDWTISSSITIPQYETESLDFSEEDWTDDIKNSWMISGGVSASHTVNYDMTLSWNLEFLVKPFTNFFPDTGDTLDSDTEYGLYLYGSLGFVPTSNLAISLVTIASPIDASFSNTLGLDWNIYETLHLLAYYSVQLGEKGDVFYWDNKNGMAITVGARYTY